MIQQFSLACKDTHSGKGQGLAGSFAARMVISITWLFQIRCPDRLAKDLAAVGLQLSFPLNSIEAFCEIGRASCRERV